VQELEHTNTELHREVERTNVMLEQTITDNGTYLPYADASDAPR
jgi:hypothetical protein